MPFEPLEPAALALSATLLATSLVMSCEPGDPPDRPEASASGAQPLEATPAPTGSTPPARPAAGAARVDEEHAPERLVTLGGTITEIVAALGHASAIVGVDTSSTHPATTQALPKVGYYRKISAEGIVSLTPDRVLATSAVGPPGALGQLEQAGLEVVEIEDAQDAPAAIARIREIGELLGEPERAEALVTGLEADLARVARRRDHLEPEPGCVLFIYARGANILMVSGTGTAAHAMIEATGHPNCVDRVDGFKPLTQEAVVAAQPEFIVVPAAGAESVGGQAGVLGLPGVALTPAGRAERVIQVDDLTLLGFGPRYGQALLALQDGLGVPEAPSGGAQ